MLVKRSMAEGSIGEISRVERILGCSINAVGWTFLETVVLKLLKKKLGFF